MVRVVLDDENVVIGKLVSPTLYRPYSITRRVGTYFPTPVRLVHVGQSGGENVPVVVWTINISPMFVATGRVEFLLSG